MELTEEQKRIVEMVKEGKTNKFMAHKLFLSERTINRRIEELCDIYGADNKIALPAQIIAAENRGYCDY